jgi:hypothetical protein
MRTRIFSVVISVLSLSLLLLISRRLYYGLSDRFAGGLGAFHSTRSEFFPAVFAVEFDGGLPHRIRQFPSPRLSATKLIQLAL